MGQKGAWPRPRDLLFKFWDPPNISGRAEGTKLKFSRGRGLGHVTYFSNFGIPLISLEWLKIQTSNFACRLTVRDTKPKKLKMGQKGAWPRPRDLLFKFWVTPNISGTAEGTKLKFSMQIDRKKY